MYGVRSGRQTDLHQRLSLQTENINGTTLHTRCAHPESYQVQYGTLAVKYVEPQADTKGGSKYWNKRLEVRLPSADGSLLGAKPPRTYQSGKRKWVKHADQPTPPSFENAARRS